MNKFYTFNKNLDSLRVATINDKILFVGKDIAKILGYKDHKATLRKNIPDSEKCTIHANDFMQTSTLSNTLSLVPDIPYSGLTGITVSGLAALLAKSKKSNTPILKKWIEDEILPELTDEPISLSKMEKVEEEDLEVIDAELADELSEFNNEEFGRIRGTLINDEPWFVGRDIAKALGYKNTKDAIITHVGKEDRRVFSRSENATIENHLPKEVFPIEFVRIDVPNRGLTIINESGVYSLIFGSKLESAKRFKHWVTSEVLPSIRKHGAYATPQTIDNIIADPDFGIRLLTQLKEERAKAKAAKEELERNKPLIDFANGVGESNTLIDMGEMAKLLCHNGFKIGRNKLFDFLRDQKIILKKKPVPYQEYVNRGYFELREINVSCFGKPHYKTKTLITGTSQQFIFNLIKENLMDEVV